MNIFWILELIKFPRLGEKAVDFRFVKTFKHSTVYLRNLLIWFGWPWNNLPPPPTPSLEFWGCDYWLERGFGCRAKGLHTLCSLQGAIQGKSWEVHSDFGFWLLERAFCPSHAMTAPVNGHSLWTQGSFWRQRKEVPPGEVTSSSLTDANSNFPPLSWFRIVLKAFLTPALRWAEILPFPLVKRCQAFLGIHGPTAALKQTWDSRASRRGSGPFSCRLGFRCASKMQGLTGT